MRNNVSSVALLPIFLAGGPLFRSAAVALLAGLMWFVFTDVKLQNKQLIATSIIVSLMKWTNFILNSPLLCLLLCSIASLLIHSSLHFYFGRFQQVHRKKMCCGPGMFIPGYGSIIKRASDLRFGSATLN
jgi:hypothetical protein